MHRAPSARVPVSLVAAASLLLISTAPAAGDTAGALRADDLPLGDHTEDLTAGDFTIRASDTAEVTVSEHSRSSETGETFTQRLQLNGAGDAEGRSVQFDAEAGETVTVYAQSGGGDADRALGLYDAEWTELDTVPAYRGNAGEILPAERFTIEEDGTYWIASPDSGVNIYAMEIGDPGTLPETTPWDEVQAPIIENLTVAEDNPAQIQVSYAGVVGPQGGDLARAFLLDETGEVVDEQISVSPSEADTIALTPDASGDYEVEVQLERHSEDAPILSAPERYEGFILPLGTPEITSVLTTEVDGDTAVATVQWNEVDEADSYTVAVRAAGDEEYDDAAEVTETEAQIADLTVAESYEVTVTAVRGDDTATSEPSEFTVAGEVQRWDTAHAGVGSGGEVTEHEDGTIEFDLIGNNGKIADSEDGFWYHYTEIDPETENFTLTAEFFVDDAEGKDNQSGFGIIAVDDFIPNEPAARYFNSAGTMTAKYEFGAGGEEGVRYGTPGGKFVHGYTGGPTEPSAERDMSDSRAFDWDYKPDYTIGSNTNPPRFETGETYTFTLRRSNTGFHSIWHRDGEEEEVVFYDPDVLLTQSEDSFYLGLFAARDIAVTVTDWDFETIHPDDDEAAEEAPTRYITPRLSADVTSTTPHSELAVPLTSTVYGDVVILDTDGEEVTETVEAEPGLPAEVSLSGLQPGENEFTAQLTPDAEQPHFDENEELESTDPVQISLSFTVDAFGQPGESIWVSPEASQEGAGTEDNPVDLHTAVAYAQPGQQIVLTDGTYALEEAVRIERGNSGTEDDPITLMSEPGARATLDLENSSGGGIILRGDWWHLYNLEITNGQGYQKPLHIQGHHNVVERIESHHNQDTGVQISGSAAEPPQMWPSYNTVVSSVAHNNADPQANDADGFAAKLTAGEGNVFRWTISYHNIDDGYDLYAKSTEGPIGQAIIEESVAFNNGWLEADEDVERTSQGMGFKLGGESQPGDHILRNSISYGNLANGVTSNSGPDPQLENVTTVYNGLVRSDQSGAGVTFYTNAETTNYRATGVISFANSARDNFDLRDQDDSFLHDVTNYFNGQLSSQAVETLALPGFAGTAFTSTAQDDDVDRPTQVTEDWFVRTDYDQIRPEIAEDGSVQMHGLFELTDVVPEDTGARLSANPNPTQIEVYPAVTEVEEESPTPTPTDGATETETPTPGPDEDGPADPTAPADPTEPGGTADPDEDEPGASPTPTADPEARDGDGLALTGANLGWTALVLAGLVLLGVALAIRSRRVHS
ncbi:right-handed parallel beta-helix repeat-containing protein [Nesterenkonia alba]|uniref:right-handed parallel beta-helix repeat-containing protein n=1 Tax=Nesterenkonia alba TaxID=515814 RepID=UPI0003B59718|nr:right-handed parallel beta-helix repeat-containing protein [Nesterenkonia alba]